MNVIPELREESLHVVGGGLWEGRVTHRVENIAAPAAQILSTALQAPTVPAYGDPHPDPDAAAKGLVVVSQDVESLGGTGARITSMYRNPEEEEDLASAGSTGTVEFSVFNLVEADEYRDVYGTPMDVQYQGNENGNELITYHMRTDVPRTQIRAAVKRVEDTPRGDVLRTYKNTVNDAAWSGDPKWTWKCEGLRAVPIQRRTRWLLFYDFIYDVQTHVFRAEVLFLGRVPSDAVEPTPPEPGGTGGNGIGYFHVFAPIDFGPLGLTIPAT